MALAGIVHVTKHDRLCRTRLLAGRLDLTVADGQSLAFGFDFALFDALHAHRTFFHHASTAHGDVRIECQIEQRVVVRIVEPVEAADFVGTVVRTVPRADTAVVDLLVQSFAAVNGGQHRDRPFRRERCRSADTSSADATRRHRRPRRSSSGRCGSSAFRAAVALRPCRRPERCFPTGRRSGRPSSRCRHSDRSPCPSMVLLGMIFRPQLHIALNMFFWCAGMRIECKRSQ